MRYPKAALLALAFILCLPALAGGGPENLFLVVNPDNPDSVAVANEYIALRQIPPINVLNLSGVPATPTISVADFKTILLRPILDAIHQRGLDPQIDYIVYSTGFPYAIDISADMAGKQFPRYVTQPASLTGMTYFRDLTLAGDTTYLDHDANFYARGMKPKNGAHFPPGAKSVQDTLQTLLTQLQAMRQAGPTAAPPMPADKLAALDNAIAVVQTQTKQRRANANALYDLTAVLALQGWPDQAMGALTAAFQAGWIIGDVTAVDTELTSLHDRQDFKDLVAQMRAMIMIPDPAKPFHSATAWDRAGNVTTAADGRHYVMSAMLAYTGGPANTLAEALQCLRTSAAADGTAPRGTIYFMASTDWARSGTRAWLFQSAVEALNELGVRGAIQQGVLPANKPDVAGAVVGIAGFNWKDSQSILLPGAFCDHLTSYAGVMTGGTGQTMLSEWLRYGAAGSSGTVTEPYAIPVKFPSPFVQVYYAAGCSLAEAFYLSIPSPYQQLLVGDPLCRPWAKIPQVRVDGLKDGQVVAKAVKLTPTSSHVGTPVRYELFVDGILRESCGEGQTLPLDPRGLAAGDHEARIVAIAGPLETTGRLILHFRVL